MLYLIEFHPVWLLLALVLGGIVGWLSFLRDKPGWSGAGWLTVGIPLFLIGLAVAAFKLLPGEAGYWLDLGLLFFGAYTIGCLLGSLLHSLFAGQAEPVGATASRTTAAPSTWTPSNGAPAPTQARSKVKAKPVEEAVGAAAAGAAAVAAARSTPSPASHPGKRPPALAAGATDRDDLKLIKGIGPKNEAILNDLGIHQFCQVAAWSPQEAEWMGHHMAFPGRIERELWIDQAKVLCAGGETEHSKAVRAGLSVDDKAIDAADIAKLKSGLPEVLDHVEGEDRHAGRRPFGTTKPLGDVADDLKLINGIGKENEARLHGLGIWHFSQIGAWDRDNTDWVGSYLAFPGRIDREAWVEQARVLAKGAMTEFAKRVKRGEVATSADDGSKGQNNTEDVKR